MLPARAVAGANTRGAGGRRTGNGRGKGAGAARALLAPSQERVWWIIRAIETESTTGRGAALVRAGPADSAAPRRVCNTRACSRLGVLGELAASKKAESGGVRRMAPPFPGAALAVLAVGSSAGCTALAAGRH